MIVKDLRDKRFDDKPFKKPIQCSCGSAEWDEKIESETKIRATCSSCGKWIKWIGFADSNIVKIFIKKNIGKELKNNFCNGIPGWNKCGNLKNNQHAFCDECNMKMKDLEER